MQRFCRGAAGLAVVRCGFGCTPGAPPSSPDGNGSDTSAGRPIFDACLSSGEKAERVDRDAQSAQVLAVTGTPSFFVNGELLDLRVVPTLADLQSALIANPIDFQTEPLLAVADDDHVKGSANAPDTIIEYADFECSACASYFAAVYPDVIASLVDTGQVKYVFRHYPLPQHLHAQSASEASECAADQGQFFAYHDLLFANRTELELADLQSYADELGLG